MSSDRNPGAFTFACHSCDLVRASASKIPQMENQSDESTRVRASIEMHPWPCSAEFNSLVPSDVGKQGSHQRDSAL